MENREANTNFKWVADIVWRWITERRVGSVTVNIFKGGISSVKEEVTSKNPNSPRKIERRNYGKGIRNDC